MTNLVLSKLTLTDRAAEALRNAILEGQLPPGATVIEMPVAQLLGISRGPLREAMRRLVEEGLLVSRPYGSTHVITLDVRDVTELYSMRTALEIFAFELAWEKRNPDFRRELRRRNDVLAATIDAGDDRASIRAELDLHSLIYETSVHQLLLQTWTGLKGRLQLYWAAHHIAHGRRGPNRTAHQSYIAAATGDSLDALRAEIRHHMQRGLANVIRFIESREAKDAAPSPKHTPRVRSG
jgi:DNA-binding GntR family transcriptional regulator